MELSQGQPHDAQTLPGRCVCRIGSLRWRHWAARSLEFIDSGRKLVAAGCFGIRVLDARTGDVLWTVPVSGGVSSLTYCDALKVLAFASNGDPFLRVHRLETRETVVLKPRDFIGACVRSIPGTTLVLSTDRGECGIRLWDLQRGQCVTRLRGVSLGERRIDEAGVVDVSRDGARAIFVGTDARLWSIDSASDLRREAWRRPGVYGVSTAISPRSDVVAVGTREGEIQLFSLVSTEERTLHGHEEKLNALQFSDDGAFLYSASSDGTCRCWDVASGSERSHVELAGGTVWSLRLAPGGRQLALGAPDGRVLLRDLPLPEGHSWGPPDATGIRLPVASRHGGLLATGGGPNGYVQLWRIPSGERVWITEDPVPRAKCAFVDAGRHILAVDAKGRARVWSTNSPVPVKEYAIENGEMMQAIVSSPSGRLVAAIHADGTVSIRDGLSGKRVAVIADESVAGFQAIAFCPDERFVACAANMRMDLYDTSRGHHVGRIDVPPEDNYLMDVASQWKLAFAGGDFVESLQVWDIRDVSAPARVFRRRISRRGAEYCAVAFSPDGEHLSYAIGRSGAGRCSIYLMRTADGAISGKLYGHENLIDSMTFSGDGRYLISGSFDGTALVWDLAGITS